MINAFRKGAERLKSNNKKLYYELNNYYLIAFVLNFVAGFFSFAWTIMTQGGLFSLAGDFNAQQITFAMAANDAIKSGNIIYDWSLDLGSNFIGGMMFYILGNPSFWLSMLFPSGMFMYVVGWIYMLKYAVAGLTSYAYLERYTRDKKNALIGSMLYAFCGYMAEDLLFYHFHDVVALFPLLMLTFDGLVLEKKRGPFIFAVAINALVNYFFLVGEIIFMAAYYILRYLIPGFNFKTHIRRLPQILIEGILGGMLGCFLLLPAFLFTIQNPRVEVDYTGSTSLVYTAERYLYILKGLVFPGEVMSHQSAVIKSNFSSCNAYIPVVGLVLVIAFVRMRPRHWLTRMLTFCLVFAVVPILNASFSLFAGVYCRWYYMAALMMVLASVMILERWQAENTSRRKVNPFRSVKRQITAGTIIWGGITLAFILFLVLVRWNDTEPSKIYRMDIFVIWSIVSLAGTFMTWFTLCYLKKYQRTILLFTIYICAIFTTTLTIYLYQQAHGLNADQVHDKIVTSARLDYEGPEYRYSSRDNIETLCHNHKASANFCSTVSGSIFRFYESLGLERDVKSPEAPKGLYNLISAKYDITTDPRADQDPIQTENGKYRSYYVYENNSIPPIGFTYDTYMTASDFETTYSDDRAILMLKTLIIPDDMEDVVSRTLRSYDSFTDGYATEEYLNAISSAHLKECARDVSETTSTYECTIDADADKYAFFSIPNDSGWSATVNDEPVDIMDINGFMAVPVNEGENRIRFFYKVPGLAEGCMLTAGGAIAILLYIFVVPLVWGRKKRR